MRPYDLHFFPNPPIYLLGFFLILGFLLALLRLGIIRYVYERLGLSSGTLGTLLGADVLHLAHIRDLRWGVHDRYRLRAAGRYPRKAERRLPDRQGRGVGIPGPESSAACPDQTM